MSGVPRCRKSEVVHASCDNCGVRPEIIHKPLAQHGARYCPDCCPCCRPKQTFVGRDRGIRSSSAAGALDSPTVTTPIALELALKSRGIAITRRVLYGSVGLEDGFEIDGYFHPVSELTADENRADVAACNFAEIRRRRQADRTESTV